MCQALSLTGISVEPDNLQACHCMKKKDWVIVKCREQTHVLYNCKTLQNKSLNLAQFSRTLFINESHENHQF